MATKQALEQQQERYSALQAEHSHLLEQHQQSKQLVTQLEYDLSLVRPLLPTSDVSVTCFVKKTTVVQFLMGENIERFGTKVAMHQKFPFQ